MGTKFWVGEALLAVEEFQRFVILNRLVSKSVSRAPEAFKPPLVEGDEVFKMLAERQQSGGAIEFFGADEKGRDADETDTDRIKRSTGHNFIWLRKISIVDRGAHRYVTMLLEFVDQAKTSFSVVDTSNLKGRDITGGKNERGGVSCHVLVRLPIKQHDDGTYRCAIETVHHINRSMIEAFICRQLRRWAHANELSYEVHTPDKKGRMNVKEYRYSPRLELYSDVGRSLSFATSGGRELAHMTFSKRSTKQSIGGKDHVKHQELIADVELRVNAKQGPEDPKERVTWLASIRSFYESNGYHTKLAYRHLTGGGILSGSVHKALAGAADLVMCQKELMSLQHGLRDWYAEIDDEIEEQMASFLDKDQLWERGK
jgi:hypothetical protein